MLPETCAVKSPGDAGTWRLVITTLLAPNTSGPMRPEAMSALNVSPESVATPRNCVMWVSPWM